MTQGLDLHNTQEWSEARDRAESYLRALRGTLGPADDQLLSQAWAAARDQSRLDCSTHPVTRVMESLFALLPPELTAPVAMTPPIKRVSMLPEPTQFPFHEGLSRLFHASFNRLAGGR